jgi:glycosyltransferase involved in cell wall biosynthesis
LNHPWLCLNLAVYLAVEVRNMAEKPAVSVIIPHLNDADGLRLCLTALAAQQIDRPIEIIVVDNGSRELPDFATSLVPGLRLLREPTPGPGPARNLGAAMAGAPLLAFIDADCVPAPGWLAAILGHFDGHPETDFAGGDIRIRPARPGCMSAVEAYENVYSYRTRLYVEPAIWWFAPMCSDRWAPLAGSARWRTPNGASMPPAWDFGSPICLMPGFPPPPAVRLPSWPAAGIAMLRMNSAA